MTTLLPGLPRLAGPLSGGAHGGLAPTRQVLIIHNPASGRPGPHRAVYRVALGMRAAGWRVDVEATARRGHTTILAAQAAAVGIPLVVAAGGDGTVNKVLQTLVGTRTALGVLPVGTVNLWAAEARIPGDADRLVALLSSPSRRLVDVGLAGSRYFLLMAGLGFDAAVVQVVPAGLKRRIGRWAYAVAGAEIAGRYAGTPVRLRLDGRELRCTLLMMVIGNTRRYAGGFRATPRAVADDGHLDVCIIRGEHPFGSLPQLGAGLAGLSLLRHGVVRARVARIDMLPESGIPMQVDGDFAGFAPTHFSVRPQSLRVAAPNDHRNGLFGTSSDYLL